MTKVELEQLVLRRKPYPVVEAGDRIQFDVVDATVTIKIEEEMLAKIANSNLVQDPFQISPENPSPVLIIAEDLSLVDDYNSGYWSVTAKNLDGDDILVILAPPVPTC